MEDNQVLNSKKKGFTFIELLIVVVVLALLFTIALFSIEGSRAKGRDTRRVADINSIQEALTLYTNENQLYPIYDGYITGSDVMSTALINSGAIAGVPRDPTNSGDYRYYYQSTQGKTYMLRYYLETDSILGHSEGENVNRP